MSFTSSVSRAQAWFKDDCPPGATPARRGAELVLDGILLFCELLLRALAFIFWNLATLAAFLHRALEFFRINRPFYHQFFGTRPLTSVAAVGGPGPSDSAESFRRTSSVHRLESSSQTEKREASSVGVQTDLVCSDRSAQTEERCLRTTIEQVHLPASSTRQARVVTPERFPPPSPYDDDLPLPLPLQTIRQENSRRRSQHECVSEISPAHRRVSPRLAQRRSGLSEAP